MDLQLHEPLLDFPFRTPPGVGEVIEVAQGVLWGRLELPFSLNHVNIYFIEDGDGWAIFDCGIDAPKTRAQWEALLAGPLAGFRFTRVIVSHHHPDHVGLAGWLCERFGVRLMMSQSEFLEAHYVAANPDQSGEGPVRQFYSGHGLDKATTDVVLGQGHGYLRMVTPLPHTFRRLVAGERLRIGGRTFDILAGGGHAAEQIMLYQPQEKLLLVADQVLAKISPNVSVWPSEPEGDPLGLYLRSLSGLLRRIDEDALALPGHHFPFRRLHARIIALQEHHAERCDMLVDACRKGTHSVSALVPVLFPRPLDPHQMSFAFSETLAHVNYLLEQDVLAWNEPRDGVRILSLA